MPGTGPLPGPSYGGVDFDAWECGSYGTLYTATGNTWHAVMETIRFGDAPTVAAPNVPTTIIVGILDGPPIDAEATLPEGTTFEWMLLYTHPTQFVGHLSSAPWIVAVGAASAGGPHILTLLPPWMSTLPYGEMHYESRDLMRFTIGHGYNEDVVLDTMTVNVQWFLRFTVPATPGPVPPPEPPSTVPPVTSPTNPPTGIINPGTVPPSVVLRTTIEKANPGFTCDIKRFEYYHDLVQVYIGQKVRLTAESYGMYLGFVGRSHVITQARFRWKAHGGGDPFKEFSSQFRLEKIPGTLLPGTGTSSAAQDAAGTGAEIGMYHQIDMAGTGVGLGMIG